MEKQDVDDIIQLWRNQRENLNQSLDVETVSDLHSKYILNTALDPSFDLPFNSCNEEPAALSPEQQLEALCEKLMDYICAGHFNIYEKLLLQNRVLANDKLETIKGIYCNIESSTDQALSFNDKYNCDDRFKVAEERSLAKDLDKLNRSLAIRYVLEEQLVEIASG